MFKPLRVLFVVPTPWDPGLGVARVSIQLSRHLTARGHTCEKWSLEDANIKNVRGAQYFVQARLQWRIAKMIRERGATFDVIQVEHDLLSFRRAYYRYNGLVISKSNGLAHLYSERLKAVEREGVDWRMRRFVGGILRSIGAQVSGGLKAVERGFSGADQIHLLNADELKRVAQIGFAAKSRIVSNGLDSQEAGMLQEVSDCQRRYRASTVVSIGYWQNRKGRREWPRIVRKIRQRLPDVTFRLLGVGVPENEVLDAFDERDRKAVDVVRRYRPSELPALLRNAKLGLFPTYVEGFGLGVLEMLAAGLPVVSWNVPGPREMLEKFSEPMLTDAGDVGATVDRLYKLLNLSEQRFCGLCEEAWTISKGYRWESIAQHFETVIAGA